MAPWIVEDWSSTIHDGACQYLVKKKPEDWQADEDTVSQYLTEVGNLDHSLRYKEGFMKSSKDNFLNFCQG